MSEKKGKGKGKNNNKKKGDGKKNKKQNAWKAFELEARCFMLKSEELEMLEIAKTIQGRKPKDMDEYQNRLYCKARHRLGLEDKEYVDLAMMRKAENLYTAKIRSALTFGKENCKTYIATTLFALDWEEKWLQAIFACHRSHISYATILDNAPFVDYLLNGSLGAIDYSRPIFEELEHYELEKKKAGIKSKRQLVIYNLFVKYYEGFMLFLNLCIRLPIESDGLIEEIYNIMSQKHFQRDQWVLAGVCCRSARLFDLLEIKACEIEASLKVKNSSAALAALSKEDRDFDALLKEYADDEIVGSILLYFPADISCLFEDDSVQAVHPFVMYLMIQRDPEIVKRIDEKMILKLLRSSDTGFIGRLIGEISEKSESFKNVFKDIFKLESAEVTNLTEKSASLYCFNIIERLPRECIPQSNHFYWRTSTHKACEKDVQERVFFILLILRRACPLMPKDLRIAIISRCINKFWWMDRYQACPKHDPRKPEKTLFSTE